MPLEEVQRACFQAPVNLPLTCARDDRGLPDGDPANLGGAGGAPARGGVFGQSYPKQTSRLPRDFDPLLPFHGSLCGCFQHGAE